jgi:hypothetical protein
MATPADDETVLPGTAEFTNSGLSYQLSDPPTDDEIAKVLESPSVFRPMKKKKELLKPILDNLEAILHRINRVKASLGTSFCNGLPANIRELENKNYTAAMLVKCLVHINTLWTIYKSLETKSFRGDETINSMFSAIADVYGQAESVAHDKKTILCKKLMVTLTPPERNRKFLQHGRLPDDNAYPSCLLCTHQSIDYANSNDKTTQDNDAAMQKHSADKLEWEMKKARNEPVGRCPTIPKMQTV